MLSSVWLSYFVSYFCLSMAQETLTCLRTSATKSETSPKVVHQQGLPGKRGAPGPEGSSGPKGSKGDPGQPDRRELDKLREEILALQREFHENLTAVRRGYAELEDGWITIFNGYQYKATPSRMSWTQSRQICRNWNGDLAVHGVQDIQSRRLFRDAISSDAFWIGLHEVGREGNWQWVDGSTASTATIIWGLSQPNDGSGLHCAYMQQVTTDTVCGSQVRLKGLCEKTL